MLCLRAELRHIAEAAVVRIDEVTRPPGQSAGDLPVRRCGRREGAAAVSEPGVRALARLVSRRDAAQGNGANGQRIGERAEHDVSAGATYRGGGRCGWRGELFRKAEGGEGVFCATSDGVGM